MSLMSERALASLRAGAERWMTDTIRLHMPSTWDDADDDLVSEHTGGAQVWEGPARIRPTRGPSEVVIGETVLSMRDADINLPLDAPEPYVDMEVLVVASGDAALVGRWFRVTNVRVFGQQATRKVSVVQFQRERDWPDTTAPDPVTNLVRAGGILTWDAPDDPDVAFYRVYTQFTGGGAQPWVLRFETDETTGDVSSWSPSSYRYAVSAVDAHGNESSLTLVT